MEIVQKATLVTEIAVPVANVELKHLKTTDGKAVVVRCEKPGQIALLRAFRVLPGAVSEDRKIDPEAMTAEQKVEYIGENGQPLIEAGTVLLGPDGEVRPAFYFGPKQPHPLSIPGHVLHIEDLVALVTCITDLSGYGDKEDSQEGAGFPAPD